MSDVSVSSQNDDGPWGWGLGSWGWRWAMGMGILPRSKVWPFNGDAMADEPMRIG